ncbi:MAG: thioredoxin family protein [Candidatus Hermodarchaeota archaeon]
MNTDLDLKWIDLVSPTMSPDDYLREFGDKISSNYKVYEPNTDVLKEITKLLKNSSEQIKIVALGANWCPDCNKNVPRMIKLVKQLKTNSIELRILYGIMVDALHKPGEALWHKTRSPPEAVNPKFDLKAIPTFYFFNKNGDYLGQIEENPQKTIEEDTLDIIKRNI